MAARHADLSLDCDSPRVTRNALHLAHFDYGTEWIALVDMGRDVHLGAKFKSQSIDP
jgi:hypothetical protein